MAVQVRFGLLQEAVKVKNAAGTIINPATEETLQLILGKLDVVVASETPGGLINSLNKLFTTFFVYKPGTTQLYLNGVRQREGVGFDYVENVAHTNVTFDLAPEPGDVLLIDYIKA